ncbi:MAG: response regulator transcription factor [Candidatus Marinimicrobia bacterium]|nr:response regulator transcription factor [Candidatus Neomarinimicrobiota bacterium]
MSKINILVVDDETFARKQISEIIQTISPNYLITEASSLSEAKSSLFQDDFSIIFLDINLKGESGFDLVPFVPKKTKIVFITAMDNYAIRAFEVNAMDYILKPPTIERVKQAIDLLTEDPHEKISTETFSMADRIFVQANNAVHFINIKDINYIQAQDVYTEIFATDGKSFLVRKSLTEWIKKLPDNDFFRIHRSTIININCMERMEPHGKGTFIVRLKGFENPFSVSRTYSANIKKRMIS